MRLLDLSSRAVAHDLTHYEVSKDVNSVRNNWAQLLEPLRWAAHDGDDGRSTAMTRSEALDDVRDEVPELDTATRSWVAAVLLGIAVLVIGVLHFFSFYVAILGAVAFIYGGFVYGLTGMAIITYRWITVPRRSPRPRADQVTVTEVHRFATGPQRNTLVLNILLLINLVTFFVVGDGDWSGGVIWGSIAQVAGAALIIVNAAWAYHRRYIIGEEEAMNHRLGRYRLIAVNRALSYTVWSTYTAAAGCMVLSGFLPGSSIFDAFL